MSAALRNCPGDSVVNEFMRPIWRARALSQARIWGRAGSAFGTGDLPALHNHVEQYRIGRHALLLPVFLPIDEAVKPIPPCQLALPRKATSGPVAIGDSEPSSRKHARR